ncbi:MAG: hypothetical protein ACRDZP_01505 [Acidimicrobiales bacterium]
MAAPAPQLTSAIEGVRLTLHVLAAAVWVGGQLVVAGLLPTVRSLSADAPKRIAAAFGRLQWPAYAVLIATGIWNAAAVDTGRAGSTWQTVFGVKLATVVLAGLGAFLHQRSRTKLGLALFGAIAGLSSVAALVLGVVIAG